MALTATNVETIPSKIKTTTTSIKVNPDLFVLLPGPELFPIIYYPFSIEVFSRYSLATYFLPLQPDITGVSLHRISEKTSYNDAADRERQQRKGHNGNPYIYLKDYVIDDD